MSKAKTAPPTSELEGLLGRLESEGAALADQQDIAGRAAKTQKAALRAEYEAAVLPLLPTLAALERKHRRVLDRAERLPFARFVEAGVSQPSVTAVERTLGELRARFNIVAKLRAIPSDIEALDSDFDSTGALYGSAALRVRMREAGCLERSIERLIGQLGDRVTELWTAYERRKVVELPSLRPPHQGASSGSPVQQQTGPDAA